MAQQREILRDGAKQRTALTKSRQRRSSTLMEKFAGYGFNKSHSAAYALVAFQTAWLKCTTTRRPSWRRRCRPKWLIPTRCSFFYKDCIDNGLAFEAPDINTAVSASNRWMQTTIRYGLGAIKGYRRVGAVGDSRRVDGSEGGPFRDLFDFCRRIDKRVVNRRVIEALIRAGAFDKLDDNRARLLASVGIALDAAEQAERNALQGGLFDMGGGAQEDTVHYVEMPRWGERERLMQEKPALGFFLSGHPFHAYAAEIGAFVKRRLGQLEPQREPVLLAGW
jgi:DNA polymerase-3 subunit alpha